MIHLISFNDEWLDACRELFKDHPNMTIEHKDVRAVQKENTCFVSPANSFGFMDGGIDYPLSRHVLPGIEPKVKQRIRQLGLTTNLGRPYLPIGSVVAVPHDSDNAHLIVAPTMFLPHDVRGTRNPYWSYFAALHMWKKLCEQKKVEFNLVLTSHCCGCGLVPGPESANQFKMAYDDFVAGRGDKPTRESEDCLLYPNHDAAQPANYDNREIHE